MKIKTSSIIVTIDVFEKSGIVHTDTDILVFFFVFKAI